MPKALSVVVVVVIDYVVMPLMPLVLSDADGLECRCMVKMVAQ